MNLDDLDVTVDGAELLAEVHAAYIRYVIFPSPEAADAVTLYTAATHAQTAWEHASRLVIKSPIKRCGKTRLQEVARELVHKALPTTNISPAALARSISQDDPPTLILDEADTVWGKKDQRAEGAEDLRGILNSGHSRGWPYVRWDATARRAENCPTFAMAIIGGIGDMPDTIEDRAVVISMRRRAPGESVTQFRRRRAVPKLQELRDRLNVWVTACCDALAEAEPDMPAEDRAADVWEPLVAIADAAGGDWPDRARKACQVLAGAADDPEDGTAGERLLADLRAVFGDAGFLYTATVIDRLVKIDEAPWAEWRRPDKSCGPITARAMAKLLKPWGIRSRNGREDGTGKVGKGYYAEDMADAWSRYIRYTATDDLSAQASDVADPVADDSAPSATGAEQSELTDVADVADVAAERSDPAMCTVCGEPLDQVLITAGLTDHGEEEDASPCSRCGKRPGGNGGRSFCEPCITEVNEENRQLAERLDKLKAEQEAELARVQSWTWERLVQPLHGTRRQRETITASRHPTGWIANLGHDQQETCSAVFDAAAAGQLDEFREFHAQHPVIWKCTTMQGRRGGKQYWCDAHLPDEYRPAQ